MQAVATLGAAAMVFEEWKKPGAWTVEPRTCGSKETTHMMAEKVLVKMMAEVLKETEMFDMMKMYGEIRWIGSKDLALLKRNESNVRGVEAKFILDERKNRAE